MARPPGKDDVTQVYGATGCVEHRQFRNPTTGAWTTFTYAQMIALAQVYTYCRLQFKIIDTPCPDCYPYHAQEGAMYV